MKLTMSFLVHKVPKFFITICLFIVVFLQCFLLLGCTNSSSTFSDVYLTKFQYNKSSDLYDILKTAYKQTNSSNLINMTITAGYLSTCIGINGDLTCTSYDSLENIDVYSGVSLFLTEKLNNSTELDLTEIAKDFSDICPFRTLLASIIINLVLFVTICYSSVPLLPGKSLFTKVNCLLSLANVALWGFGSMLQHVAVQGAVKLIPSSSMTIIEASKGVRAEAMIWTTFAFLVIVCLGNVTLYICQLKKKTASEFQPKF